MSFCASCGRERDETARFCGGCGAEHGDATPASGTPAPDAASASAPTDATKLDVDPEVTRTESPAARTDPFASWYQQQPPAPGQAPPGPGADQNWQPTQTVQATPTQAAGYPPGYPPSVPAPPPFPPGPPPYAPPPTRGSGGGGGRWLFIVVAVVVVLAAGGGAYALATSLGKHNNSAQPTGQPTVGASTPPAGTTSPPSPSATSSATSPSPAPSPTLSLVAISTDIPAGTVKPQVETLLSHYFHGINSHDYQEYASTLNATQLAKQPQSQFESGYGSTTDSGMTLTGLSGRGDGGLTATVTFTSRQSPSASVDHSACNAWTLNLYLVPQGSGYLIGPAPSGYQPTYSDC